MKIPKNRPASTSSYRGNPTHKANRKKLLDAWKANPTATNQQIADLCGVAITTACECKPYQLKQRRHYLLDKSIKTDIQRAIADLINDNPKITLGQVAAMVGCGKSTVWRIKQRLTNDRLRQSVQTPPE